MRCTGGTEDWCLQDRMQKTSESAGTDNMEDKALSDVLLTSLQPVKKTLLFRLAGSVTPCRQPQFHSVSVLRLPVRAGPEHEDAPRTLWGQIKVA